MNPDRIREIANQASTYAEGMVAPYWGLEDGLDYPARMLKVRDLKFTELVVAECLMCCGAVHDAAVYHRGEYDAFGLGAEKCQAVIKKHFGVE
jgi:hypothetical protein